MENKVDKLIDDTLSDIIRTFKNHSSIMHIKENINKNFKFSVILVTRDEVIKETNQLNLSKPQPYNDIPTKVIKVNRDIFSNFITH